MKLVLPHGLRVGDFVVVAQHGSVRGLGRIEELVEDGDPPYVRVTMQERFGCELHLTAETVQTLQPPIGRADAEGLIQIVRVATVAPDTRPSTPRFLTNMKTLSEGSWKAIAERLAILYASRWKLTFGGRKMIQMYEETLLPLLAHAAGQSYETLGKSVRQGKPVFAATEDEPERDEPPQSDSCPELSGYEALYDFEVSKNLWLGERLDWFDRADSGLARLDVQPGRWYSYRTLDPDDVDDDDDDDDDDEPPMFLLLIHESRLRERKKLAASKDWTKAAEILNVVGGIRVNVIDSSALTDEGVMDEVKYLGGTNCYGGRAVCVACRDRWSGPLPVQVPKGAGPVTVVRVPLNDAAAGTV